VAHSLRGEGFDASEDGTGRGTPLVPVAIAFDCKASGQSGFGVGDVASTMRAMGHANTHQNGGGHQAVAFAQNQRDEVRMMDVAGAIAAEPGMKQQTYVSVDWAVRRLTPTECERLQGFPDGYTNVPWRGKNGAPDGPRYKALGNSMAVNAMRWIGTRIEKTAELTAEITPHHGGTP
jgi:DNA (cytosine-5)-methyltransferase 1